MLIRVSKVPSRNHTNQTSKVIQLLQMFITSSSTKPLNIGLGIDKKKRLLLVLRERTLSMLDQN